MRNNNFGKNTYKKLCSKMWEKKHKIINNN